MKSRDYLLATASGVAAAAAAGGSQAADLAIRKAPPPAAPPVAAPSWAGFYVGGSLGAAWERMSDNPQSPYGIYETTNGAPTSTNTTSFIGGGEIGYNWQFGNIVAGLEGDFSGLSQGSSNFLPFGSICEVCGSSSRVNWISTIRGRLGTTVFNPSWLVYATGGVAWGKVNNTFNFGDPGALGFVNNKSVSTTRTGWTAGGGVQYMITPNWIAGAEVLYVDLGTSSYSIPNTNANPAFGPVKTTTFKNTVTIARFKLDYKF
jgi:outer membrane immunogenic protein